jgi:hypothetical protein
MLKSIQKKMYSSNRPLVNGCLVGELVVSRGCLDKLAFVVEHTTLTHLENKFFNSKQLKNSVPDPWHFYTDPNPALFISGFQDADKKLVCILRY